MCWKNSLKTLDTLKRAAARVVRVQRYMTAVNVKNSEDLDVFHGLV